MKVIPAPPPSVRRSEILSRLSKVLSEYDVRANVGRSKKHYFIELQIGHTPREHSFGVHIAVSLTPGAKV